MTRGKHLQIGSGSRSRSVAKAEDKARRSRKKADKRASLASQMADAANSCFRSRNS